MNMAILRSLLGLMLAVLLTAVQAQGFVAVPPLTSHVTDTVGMLSADQRTALDNVLKDYEDRTGSQVAVLLLSSTAPEAIEQYSIRVADAWKLGRKGVDDGVILVVAKDNPKALRRLRIEAGRGVQGTLTDAQSKRILQDVIAPHFRQNDFYGGLVAGVSAITNLLDQEKFPSAAKQQASQENTGSIADLLPLLFIVLIVVGVIMSRARGSHRSLSSDGWGRTAGVILGSGIGRGGFGGGGFGGGGFGGRSGGGFSGGGGGFDGGGASGDW
jgi:uncharacterized protein